MSAARQPGKPARSSARTKARKQALDILFEADLRELPAAEILSIHAEDSEVPIRDFTVALVTGVTEQADIINQAIVDHLSEGWSLQRMPRVDRNLARVACYELMFTATATDVILAEAIGLCQELSTDESPAFLNGLLSSIAATRSAATN